MAGAACTCTVPSTLGGQPWPCADGGPCPAQTTCIEGLCQPISSSTGTAASSGGSSSAGRSTGASSGGTETSSGGSSTGASTSGGGEGTSGGGSTGGLPPGQRCDAGSDCQSGFCALNCCQIQCNTSDTICGVGAYCDSSGACRYLADGVPCGAKSCNPTTNPESLTSGLCDAGMCSPPSTRPCPNDRPLCNQSGDGCVACNDASAGGICGGASCCDPKSGACVGICPSGSACCSPGGLCEAGKVADGGACSAGSASGSCCAGLSCCGVPGTTGFCAPGLCGL
jgi:hypothetical protein